MRRHRPILQVLIHLALIGVVAFAVGCKNDEKAPMKIQSPKDGAVVTSCEVPVRFEIGDDDITSYVLLLDAAPAGIPTTEGPADHYEGVIGPESLTPGPHTLELVGTRASDGSEVTRTATFTWAATASAKRISAASELITGPLAHGEVGDYLLENCFARYVV